MPRAPLDSPTLQSKALLAFVVLVTVLFLVVLWPLSGAVSWAIFLAIVFASLQDRSVRVCKGRRGWAAFGTLVVIVVSVILPAALLFISITHEATAFYDKVHSGDVDIAAWFQSMMDALPGWARTGLSRIGIDDLPALQKRAVSTLGSSGQAITAHAVTIGHGTLDFLLNFFVMLYLLYFLLRDGRALAQRTADALPLEPHHTRRLFDQFAVVVRATVKGNFVLAIVQGALGGIAFWFLGIKGALLWSAVMALLSLLPAVGVPLVWGPFAIWLLSTGQVWQGIALIVWGTVVIGLVDNLLRPVLVGKEAKLPDYLVLIATLGGLSVFGPNGFVLGPAIAALFITSWELFAGSRHEKPSVQETMYAAEPTESSRPPAS